MARAQGALLAAQICVWRSRRGTLARAWAEAADPAGGAPPPLSRDDGAWCAALALAVDRAARYGVFRPRCLARAIALQRLLDRQGIRGTRIRVGVRRTGERLDAHAWVERGGVPVGPRQGDVTAYAPLRALRVEAGR